MIGQIEHFFRTWRRRVSRSEWAIRFLGLPVSRGTATEPGLILIQIDGLSRRQMERALERGRLPFLGHLIRDDCYETHTFYSGLPSSTPAVQGELYYGSRCAVPAFGFMDRATGRVLTMFDTGFTRSIEETLCKRADGLMHGGSSWCNIYTGGADADGAHFCAAAWGFADLFRSQTLWQLVSFPFLHFTALLRILALVVIELFIGFRDMLHGWFRGQSLLREFYTLVSRALIGITLRELVTIGVQIDAARGLPIIHVNFVGYDEQAHRRGPSSAFAHWSLMGIDRAIRVIARSAQRSMRRDYQVWIFSDHGQETTRLFEKDGRDILQVLREAIAETKDERFTGNPSGQREVIPTRRRRGPRGRTWVAEHTQPDSPHVHAEKPFTFVALGPVGHLYLATTPEPKEKRELANRLVRTGVPGVLLHDDNGKVEWIHAAGSHTLPDEALGFLPHPDPLKLQVARDMAELCNQKLAGDLVLLGWSPDAPPLTFSDEQGAHAGPGIEETQGFVFLPHLTRLPTSASEFIRPVDLRAAALHHLERAPLTPSGASKGRIVTEQLRVMTYNVHSCRGMDGRVSPRRIAKVIQHYNPDVVALQELDLGRVRSQHHDQPRLIADALGMHLCFCPTVVTGGEQYGHALLTRHPIELVRTQILCAGRRFGNAETRGALWVRVDIDGLVLNLMNTHFGLKRSERQAQANDLLSENWIGGIHEDEPLIVCGDFNMLPRSRPYRELARRLRDVQCELADFLPLNTFTTFHPFARIDHVFVSRHFVPEQIRVPRSSLTRVASDHLPLIVDLSYRKRV